MWGISDSVALMILTGVGTWTGQALLQRWKSKEVRVQVDQESAVKLEQHRDGLTLEILKATRAEIEVFRAEVTRLRPLETHMLHFEQALQHIEALIFGTEAERPLAERNARAFLVRMKRLSEARGTLTNEAQIASSSADLILDAGKKGKP